MRIFDRRRCPASIVGGNVRSIAAGITLITLCFSGNAAHLEAAIHLEGEWCLPPTVTAVGGMIATALPGAALTLTLPVVKERNRFVSVDPLPNVVELPAPLDNELAVRRRATTGISSNDVCRGSIASATSAASRQKQYTHANGRGGRARFVFMDIPPSPGERALIGP